MKTAKATGRPGGGGGGSPPRWGSPGLSLIEVLIYSVLSLALMGLAVWSLSGLQKGAGRGQELSRLHGDAGEAVRILAQDARNLGLKRIVYPPSPGSLADTQLARVDFGPADSSSFLHANGNPYDTLTFLKPRLDGVGKPVGIDTVRYAADPATRVLSRTVNGGAPMEICRQVEALQYEYGVFAAKTELINQDPPAPAQWSQSPAGSLVQSGTSLKASLGGAGTATFWNSGRPLALDAKHVYRLEIGAMAPSAFAGRVDSLYAILCNGAGTPIARQSFLPPTALSTLHLEWGGVACADCYAGFEMVMKAAGEFTLASLKLTDVEQGDGAWVARPTPAEKKAVRAIKVRLLTRGDRDMRGIRSGSLRLADITLAYNDKLVRSLLEDVIAVPNNGY